MNSSLRYASRRIQGAKRGFLTTAPLVAEVRVFGFTERQAHFLVLVLEHSGMCLPRQYRTFAGIAHGRQKHDLFE